MSSLPFSSVNRHQQLTGGCRSTIRWCAAEGEKLLAPPLGVNKVDRTAICGWRTRAN
ncbi:UNVERIFIED_CONTAM: hypothetical protein Slati_4202700 [Sesamum latifolium]|uniref:Uncharacterized protein n=1 Tax=Sesamum latifolium TaxID=2727402 RepID=A0AAW2TAB3_9LAMI